MLMGWSSIYAKILQPASSWLLAWLKLWPQRERVCSTRTTVNFYHTKWHHIIENGTFRWYQKRLQSCLQQSRFQPGFCVPEQANKLKYMKFSTKNGVDKSNV
jgi:hypothetical protein